MMTKTHTALYLFFAITLVCNIALWFYAHRIEARWDNVPPAPSMTGAKIFGIGDPQFSYRLISLILQNFGNIGAENEPLSKYNYDNIGQWLKLADRLDSQSDYTPLLAAFYFSATQNPKQLAPVVDYLAMAGRRDDGTGEKWRWLAQAVYLARWREHDMSKALSLANELTSKWRPGRPLWIKEMPAFVMTASGDKKGAYELMLNVLNEEKGKVQQAELNNTMFFMCHEILGPADAATNPICTSLPPDVK